MAARRAASRGIGQECSESVGIGLDVPVSLRSGRHGGEVLFDIDDLMIEPSVIPDFLRTIGIDRDDEHAWTHWFA